MQKELSSTHQVSVRLADADRHTSSDSGGADPRTAAAWTRVFRSDIKTVNRGSIASGRSCTRPTTTPIGVAPSSGERARATTRGGNRLAVSTTCCGTKSDFWRVCSGSEGYSGDCVRLLSLHRYGDAKADMVMLNVMLMLMKKQMLVSWLVK
ncbi:hypothetical protein Droror1_Dr00008013 [Drosera rotundifolia]